MIDPYWILTNQDLDPITRDRINEYLLSLKVANKAEATITKNRQILDYFFRKSQLSFDQLTSENILKWLNAYAKGKKPKTVALVFSTLSTFFPFCESEDYLDHPLMKKRWQPRIPEVLPKPLNKKAVFGI
ncbi:site-specific integrase [Alteribacillus bidgolensis]|uniref:Phage integrase, N-terminal SAM-like domain n=1 Tax=Alteribacillus bidgolensis TaxID=930129 RepID=A0A1G8M6K8_9BACI|nr:site-specific integrase [Alteribacillus bidgolensis]SDI63582.1 Phage integrase, N-terminal SAM-like domain [Alteribacillus bidgolensis]